MALRSRIKTAMAVAALATLATACGSTAQMTSTATAGLGGDGMTPGGVNRQVSSGPTTPGGAISGTTGGSTGRAPGTSYGTASGGTTGTVTLPVDSGPTVAANQPIQIGFVLTSTTGVSAAGYSSGESYSEQQVDTALVNAMNAQGGIAGHKIVPVFAKTDPNSTSWATDFAAACATLTEDHHVIAVLGYQFNYDQGFETCLSKKGIPHLTTGFNIPDAIELAKHPLHRSLAVPTIDHRSLAKLEGAWQDGVLTSKSIVGIGIDGCPGTHDSWNRVAKPWLVAHHIKYVLNDGSGCSDGNNAGAAAGANSVPNALLQFRRQGVDTVMLLMVSEGPALIVVASAAEAQKWYPKYIVSSLGNLSALEGNKAVIPQDQLANVIGYGWMPAQDLDPALQPPKTPNQTRCLALLKSQQIKPANFGDFTNAYRLCDAVFAYEAAVKKVNGDVSAAAVIRGLDSLGTSFDNPDVLDGATVFGRGHENVAPAHMRQVIWNKPCGCFNYHGATRPLP